MHFLCIFGQKKGGVKGYKIRIKVWHNLYRIQQLRSTESTKILVPQLSNFAAIGAKQRFKKKSEFGYFSRCHAHFFEKNKFHFLMQNLIVNRLTPFKIKKNNKKLVCHFVLAIFHFETKWIKGFYFFFPTILDSWEFLFQSVGRKKISRFTHHFFPLFRRRTVWMSQFFFLSWQLPFLCHQNCYLNATSRTLTKSYHNISFKPTFLWQILNRHHQDGKLNLELCK